MRPHATFAAFAMLCLSLACSGTDATEATSWRTSVDTLADTIVVRTVGAQSPRRHTIVPEMRIGTLEGEDEYTFGAISEMAVNGDGDMFVFDRQAMQLRRYDPRGTFVRAIGRKGGGPGEYDRVNGLAIAGDGRVFLWDAGNARITIYAPDGEPETTYRLRGGFYTSNALFVDSIGRVYTRVSTFGADVSTWRQILVRYGTGGTPVDTLDVPRFDMPRFDIVARREGGTSQNNVPFTPATVWALAPDARFVYGRSDVYAVYRDLPDGKVMRIERDARAVGVSAEEKSENEERATWQMRRMDPAWKWNGPPIPDTKPYFKALRVSQEGRTWVRLSEPGELDPEADTVTRNPDRPPTLRYRERQVWDVFSADGRYLGQVELPFAFTMYAMRGDQVWGVQRDELDVQSVVRARIEPPLERRATEFTVGSRQ